MAQELSYKDANKGVLTKVQLFMVTGTLLLSISAGFVGGWLGASSRQRQNTNSDTNQARQIVLNESQAISNIVKEVGESVVSVNVVSNTTATDFFGLDRPVRRASAGTGFIISADGIVLTNRHVIPNGTSRVSVTLSDGTELEDVEVIGRTNNSDPLDIAFLKIKDAKGKQLKAAQLGESAQTEVGSRVIAIGNALGQFQNTVTTGVLSGYGRSLEAYSEGGPEALQNLFQTDAAINQGNSGGPLVDIHGQVIGVNTAVAAGGAENIGFAIPIDDVKGIIASVLETGKVQRPYLGVRYVQLTDDYAYEHNLSVKRGAYIVPSRPGAPSILADSPAAKSGLKEKDTITEVAGETVDERQGLVSLIGRHKVGEEITLGVVSDGQEKEVVVKLEAAPTD